MRTLIVLCLLLAALPALRAAEAPAPGASLAGLALYDLDGRRHALDAVTSKYVVIVWWAFWCDTWKQALPHVSELAAHGSELDCTVWAVSVDGTYTSEVRPRHARGELRFPVLLDDGTWADRLSIRRVPTVMLLDAARTVVWVREAYPGNRVIERAIRTGK